MKRKNVLEIINLFSSASNFIGNQFTYLREHGYNMHLICCDDPRLQTFAEKQQIKYKPIYLKRDGLSIISDIKALISVCKYIKDNNIDTVIAHQSKARLIGTTAAFLMQVPNRIIFAHGVLYETMHGAKHWMIKTMDKIVAAMAHKVICVSNSVCKVRLKDKINSSSKQFLLNKGTCGGIDTQKLFNPDLFSKETLDSIRKNLALSDKDFVIGFCGRLVKDKGIVELIDAFHLLLRENSEKTIKLMIIGEKEIRDSIPEFTKNIIENNPNIIYTGFINREEIPAYYMQMDVFVLPSYREGFPTVILEANAMGIPCIVSTSTGCIDSIQENITGNFTEISPDSLAKTIKLYLNKEYRDRIAANCRKFIVDNYDHQVVWPHIIDIIEK